METDYTKITEKDFEKNIREFLAYEIKSQTDNVYTKNNVKVRTSKKLKLEPENWHLFSLDEIFSDFCSGKISNTKVLDDGDDIYYLGAKKDNNGVISKHKYNEQYISKGNCIVMICDGQGSIGYNNYMNQDFFGTINLALGYNNKLNKYNAMFLVSIMDLERPKYSFGRKRKPTLTNSAIKLPAKKSKDKKGNIIYEPDWKYMENYIKSLPYADLI